MWFIKCIIPDSPPRVLDPWNSVKPLWHCTPVQGGRTQQDPSLSTSAASNTHKHDAATQHLIYHPVFPKRNWYPDALCWCIRSITTWRREYYLFSFSESLYELYSECLKCSSGWRINNNCIITFLNWWSIITLWGLTSRCMIPILWQ